MEISKIDRLPLYADLKKKLSGYTNEQIEHGVMFYCLSSFGKKTELYKNTFTEKIADILKDNHLSTDFESIIEFFESLLEENDIDGNGIVFTPQYIANYITQNIFSNLDTYDSTLSIIDPGCGCGIFLITAAEYIASKFNVDIDTVIENNIYGIDIDENNVRRCSLILQLLSAKHNGSYTTIKTHIICRDSLKCNWSQEFHIDSFDYIIGNPPYVNPHILNKDTVTYLKKHFVTTKNGVFNLFYAFIEYAMEHLSLQGMLGYIVPNNFLTIKSALELRKLLQERRYLLRILDFGDNMIFKPVRTYNCILILSKEKKEEFEYCTIPKHNDISLQLSSISYYKIPFERLDKNGWKLVDKITFKNLQKIESQMISIKDFIRTGIATLRDNVYLVDKDQTGYFKESGGEKIYIESGLVKPIYKIPELKLHDNIEDAKRYIIFPYVKSKNGYILIDEETFTTKYPNTYFYLKSQKANLDSRDNGKGAAHAWYAYGRTQGLNKYGKKLLFPTFSNKPKFIFIDNEESLFCNGYAVFENDTFELDILQKILNSRLMDYYVSNTSYSIEGGYYCYQKKYVERFSLPCFTPKEIDFIRHASKNELDNFLWTYYSLV